MGSAPVRIDPLRQLDSALRRKSRTTGPGTYRVRRSPDMVATFSASVDSPPPPPPPPPSDPPSAPSALAASSITDTTAVLTWTAATDDVGVDGYEVSVPGSTWEDVGNVLTTTLTGLSAGTDYTASVRAYDTDGQRGDPDVVTFSTTGTPPTVPFFRVASAPHDTATGLAGRTVLQAQRDMFNVNGYNGLVLYVQHPSASDISGIASSHGSDVLMIQYTIKQEVTTAHNSAIQALLNAVPDAWRPWFLLNHFQEPEDDIFGTPTKAPSYTAAQYLSSYVVLADNVRTWNAANPSATPFQLPWLEFHEFDNSSHAAGHTWIVDRDSIIPDPGDFTGILWSVFEYRQTTGGTQHSPPSDSIQAQVDNVLSKMSRYAPGQPWGWMAGAYTLEPGSPTGSTSHTQFTTAQYRAQSDWMEKSYTVSRTGGAVCWGWYNVNFPGTGSANGDGRLELNDIALPKLQALPIV